MIGVCLNAQADRKTHPRIARSILDTVVPDAELPKEKNPAAVVLGRLGGLKGGVARFAKLTAEQRKEIARNAVKTRWKKD